MSDQERKPSAAMVLESAALAVAASLEDGKPWEGWIDARHALHCCALEYAASCGQLDAKERAELEALRQMRDGLVGLRNDINEDRDCGSYASDIDALLAMCGGQR